MKPIGIRREDKSRWERRTPITPELAGELVKAGGRVLVQPAKNRIFPDEEFARRGAEIAEDLSPCSFIFGVKEIPPDLFLPDTAYVFFAHVIKGQEYNMPMLRRMMERRCHLVDYEKIVDDKGRRLVLFGRHAGLAGMVEVLRAIGLRLAWEGCDTPLAKIKMALEYDSLEEVKKAIAEVADDIRDGNWPDEHRPFVVGFAGYGNVSQGAQEIFQLLRPREIEPQQLFSLQDDPSADSPFVQVVFYEKDMVVPVRKEAAFDLQEYYQEPEKYRPVFEAYLPHLSALINAIYWEEKYPRLVTLGVLKKSWSEGRPKLRVIGDITCDIGGAVEATVKAMEPGKPCFVYEPDGDRVVDGVEGEGPVMMTVDILPSELPRESSLSFSEALAPFLPAMAKADLTEEPARSGLPEPIRKALILHKGELTEEYRYLASYLGQE